MKKYSEYSQLDLTEIDKEILQFWGKQKIFEKSIDRADANTFVFYEGPPSANGKPGIHHVMARTIKDLFCRFHSMLGERVERRGGWDTHGLPIELSVEKELGITKEDIGTKISIAEYNQKCRETVMRYKDLWDDITRKIGYWVDLDHPYITFTNDYIESVWYLLKQLYDKDLMYKGYTIQPYSPAAGTGLSSHELNMPGAYRDVKDTSMVAQFKIIKSNQSAGLFKGIDTDQLFFLAWTTTPWTLPSNTALAVGAKIDYVRVKTYNPYTKNLVYLILAEELLPKWFSEKQKEADFENWKEDDKTIPYQITGKFKGKKLEGITYEQLLPFAQPENGDAFRVLLGDFVSTEEGTGIVHIAPSFGADDMRVAKKYGIGSLTLVDKQGKFTEDAGEFAGRYVKNYKDEKDYVSPDIDIAVKLKQENRAFNIQKYSHNYPHCWRTDKPVLYYPIDSWFIKSTACKDRMVELNKEIRWKPAHTGEKRFGNWLENLQDWNLSRSRFWGTPLPIWGNSDRSEWKCIGSIAELRNEIELANRQLGLQQSVPEDLHRPFIDKIILVDSQGKEMQREPDLIDVWFDSGSMPYAQWHYPFEHAEKFQDNFPADFIAEGVDQTRGWFFTLHAIAVMVFDQVSFKNVVSNGLVQDKDGRKMSKRLGNAVEPFETIAKYGADATRWYLISNAQVWDNLRFDLSGIEEVRRKFFGTLYNTYSFFALYANIDLFQYQDADIDFEERPEIDQWVLSSLNTLSKSVRDCYADYEATTACRMVQDWVDDKLSNWYVRLSRRRFWKGQMSQDKISAYQTLYTCLDVIARLMAPVAPFFADWLFNNLNQVTRKDQAESVHLSAFPAYIYEISKPDLEEKMELAQQISSMVLSLRKKEKIRVRQPLKKILIPILEERIQHQIDAVSDLILTEVNVKEIEYIKDTSGLIKKTVKPNFKTLGRRLGKDMKEAAGIIDAFDQMTIEEIETNEGIDIQVGENHYHLSLEDLIISSEDIPGWQVVVDNGLTVALDVHLNDELLAEGTARELVNRIQNLRKSNDFDVTDRIRIKISKNQSILPAIEQFGEYIKSEVLADEISLLDEVSGASIELFDDVKVQMELERI